MTTRPRSDAQIARLVHSNEELARSVRDLDRSLQRHKATLTRRIGWASLITLGLSLAALGIAVTLLALGLDRKASTDQVSKAQRTALQSEIRSAESKQACQARNSEAGQSRTFFAPLLSQETAEAHPDPVIVKILATLVSQSITASNVKC